MTTKTDSTEWKKREYDDGRKALLVEEWRSDQAIYHERPILVEGKLIHENAKWPKRSRKEDAGFDLYAVSNGVVKGNSQENVNTGVILSAPQGWYFTIEGRSSLFKLGIKPLRGIIDATYCGELMVSLSNESATDFEYDAGDRIAQLVLHKAEDFMIREVEEFSPDYNIRGTNGFGSTGK